MGIVKEIQDLWESLSKNKIMKTLIIILMGLIIITAGVILVKIYTGSHVKLLGFEINDQSKIDTPKKLSPVTTNKDTLQKTLSITKPIVNNALRKKTPIILVSRVKKGADTVKKYSKYDLSQATFNQSAVGDNASVTNNNYGIQPRKITKEFMDEFEAIYPDKNVYIGFIAPSSSTEILNVKQQLITQLKLRNYTNIEETNGIRLVVGSPDEKPNQIILEKNAKGGVSFFICSVTN